MRPKLIEFATENTLESKAILAAYARHGALLLRGGNFNLERFEALTQHFCPAFHEVGTRQVMRQQTGDGFSTEVFRDNFILLGHCEGAYRPFPPPPEVCFFMCVSVVTQFDAPNFTIRDGCQS